MTNRTLPLLFLNLGGEMMYILDQRLSAQNVSPEKSKKVLNDIVGTMLNKKFIEELFKPQEIFSKQALRTLFENLAHASIMRLNTASMDKLYDLMIMAFKYQVFMAPRPTDILLITLNHIDAIRSYVSVSSIQKQVDMTYAMFMKTFAHLQFGELQTVRYCILNYLHDLRVRVSVFLRDKAQNPNGHFVLPTGGPVPPGQEVPGAIRAYDLEGDIYEVQHFYPGGEYLPARDPGSLELHGDRGTNLGCNIYASLPPHRNQGSTFSIRKSSSNVSLSKEALNLQESCLEKEELQVGREELKLLEILLGNAAKPKVQEFQLNLFNNEKEEEEFAQHRLQVLTGKVVNIDARLQSRSLALDKVYSEMCMLDCSESSSSHREDGDDLLDLMDSLQ